MFQVRIHGRGGQGVVTAAELLSVAAFEQGLYAQAFPSFGSERMGAPVAAFCRVSDHEIRTREPVMVPDALVIQDATLIHQVDLFSGIDHDAYVILNSSRAFDELGLTDVLSPLYPERLLTLPASEIATRLLGRAMPNSASLGALSGLTGIISIDAISSALRKRFTLEVAQANLHAARDGYAQAVARRTERSAMQPVVASLAGAGPESLGADGEHSHA